MKIVSFIGCWVAAFGMTQFASVSAKAGEADVVDVTVSAVGDKFSFSVTVKHADEGWDHYADRWEIVGEDGMVYGTRILVHPHVDEQPFTRSMSGVEVPEGVKVVIVRAGDSVHDLGGVVKQVTLPGR